ncbi:MAG TPA: PH domain-containing protein [Povalibacter sp.]|uniref:PH domain-containing protein n=1 Tax=Povalibacter sp. TaxID=1962978 RepID=UPI002C8D8B5F|nr:PH domain-containing protein [Povalibacter sp.]HMN46283.1 PH domain-containing protein [Povalibacter sp.]
MASETDFQPELRLHPLSWLFALATFIRQFIVPVIAFMIFGARNDAELWGALILVPLLVGALWQQWLYRYGFGPRGLVIKEGLFFRNLRQIEYPRIENIDVKRGLLHRLLGVAEVSIATSTGGKAEATIRVLSLEATQELRDQVFNRGRPAPTHAAPAAQDEVLLQLPPAELIRYGLIDNRGMIVVAALFGFLYQAGTFEISRQSAAVWFEQSQLSHLAALGIAMQAGLALAGLVTFVLTLRLLSVGFALVTLFDFTLTRHGQDLRVRHGLLTRLALTLRIPRIQSVHQTQSLLHRLFGRVSLRVDLAGDSSSSQDGKQQSQVRTRWLAPICTPMQAKALMAVALPDVDFAGEPNWQPLAPHARQRLFRQSVYFATFVAAAITLALHLLPEAPFEPDARWTVAFLAVMLLLGWWRADLYVKHTRWALTPDAVLFRYGWLTRRLIVTPRNRLQSVQLTASPFDRRHRMANVSVDTAGGSAMSDRIAIRFLPRRIARALALRLYHSHIDRAGR